MRSSNIIAQQMGAAKLLPLVRSSLPRKPPRYLHSAGLLFPRFSRTSSGVAGRMVYVIDKSLCLALIDSFA